MIESRSTAFFLGVEIGLQREPAALAIIERELSSSAERDPSTYESLLMYEYNVRFLERIKPGASYPEILARLQRSLRLIEECGKRTTVILNATAVGQPVIELVREELAASRSSSQAEPPILQAVCIASPTEGTTTTRYTRILKRDLIQTLIVMFQKRQLRIARSLSETAAFTAALDNMRLRKATTSMDAATWREEPSDDLVFAVALAAWKAKRTARMQMESRNRLPIF